MRSRITGSHGRCARSSSPPGVAACGGDDDRSDQAASAAAADSLKGQTVRLWIMNNGPDPKADTEKMLEPFKEKTGIKVKVELVGWDVQFDRIRNAAVSGEGPDVTQAGTTQVPFFAALAASRTSGPRRATSAATAPTRRASGRRPRSRARTARWPCRGSPRRGRSTTARTCSRRPASTRRRRSRLGRLAGHARDDQGQGARVDGKQIEPFGSPGKKAFDLVHHVMPFVWDAGGAELNEDAKTVDDQLAAGASRASSSSPTCSRTGSATRASSSATARRSRTSSRAAGWPSGSAARGCYASATRTDDENWVPDGPQERRRRADAAGPAGEAYTFVGGSNLMMFKSSKNKDAAWELMKFLSQDQVQTEYADLMGMFPARLEAQEEVGDKDDNHESFSRRSSRAGPTRRSRSGARSRTPTRPASGTSSTRPPDTGKAFSPQTVATQLDAAAKEADGCSPRQGG